MGQCSRLVKAIIKTFPTVESDQVNRHIQVYRRNRDLNQTDFEGLRGSFRKIIRISINRRHPRNATT